MLMDQSILKKIAEMNLDTTTASIASTSLTSTPVSNTVKIIMEEDNVPSHIRESVERSGKNPMSIYSEMVQQMTGEPPQFEYYPRNQPFGNPKVLCVTKFEGETIEGQPKNSKKDAKLSCALKGLQSVMKGVEDSVTPRVEFKLKTTIFEILREHTYAKFFDLCKNNSEMYGCEKVIASVFLKFNHKFRLISLATGNKGLNGDQIVADGSALVDCHAEILARRGFMRFIYGEILQYCHDPSKSIFLEICGKMSLKTGISFHLFINTAPCGVARVAKKLKTGTSDEIRNTSKLRFKIDKGMGTILGENNADPQTFDGILIGERMRTMSCSDKLLKTNVLGVQGALLTHFVEPIYYTTISVAEQNNAERMNKAVNDRLEGFTPPLPFRVHRTFIGECQTDDTDKSTSAASRSSFVSVNWNLADGTVEVVKTLDGLVHERDKEGADVTKPSRLSKKSFGELIKKVCNLTNTKMETPMSYEELKAGSKQYQAAKKEFFKFLQQQDFGVWQQKPREFEMFNVQFC